MESGTTGYLGQAMVILKGETECYECTPKPSQKVYPICTIRSTPDKPVHCVVYAKEVYKLLFGQMAESMLYEDTSNGATSVYMDAVSIVGIYDGGHVLHAIRLIRLDPAAPTSVEHT